MAHTLPFSLSPGVLPSLVRRTEVLSGAPQIPESKKPRRMGHRPLEDQGILKLIYSHSRFQVLPQAILKYILVVPLFPLFRPLIPTPPLSSQ